ncbi:MAG: hypothetical protein AABZ30_08475 [Myxococcota bacterium]
MVDIVLAFFAAVLAGARRFAHVERLRADEIVHAILGVARMTSAMTLTRYFGGLVRSQVEHMADVMCCGTSPSRGCAWHRWAPCSTLRPSPPSPASRLRLAPSLDTAGAHG